MQGKDRQDRNAKRTARTELPEKDQTKKLQTAKRFFLPGANLKKYIIFPFSLLNRFLKTHEILTQWI
jgi:hypothetical protein